MRKSIVLLKEVSGCIHKMNSYFGKEIIFIKGRKINEKENFSIKTMLTTNIETYVL